MTREAHPDLTWVTPSAAELDAAAWDRTLWLVALGAAALVLGSVLAAWLVQPDTPSPQAIPFSAQHQEHPWPK